MPGHLLSSAAGLFGLAAGVGLAVAGCGGSSSTNGVAAKSPAAILATSRRAAETATSVHVVGSLTAAGAPTRFDVDLVGSRGGRGTISAQGLSFKLIRIGSTIYVKGTPAYYRRFSGAVARRLRGRWLMGRATTSSFAAIGRFTDQRSILDQVLPRQLNLKLTKGATTTVAGQRVVQVKDPLGGTLSVAITGNPFPVQIATGGTPGQTIAFDRWNAAVRLRAPRDAIDVDQLRPAR